MPLLAIYWRIKQHNHYCSIFFYEAQKLKNTLIGNNTILNKKSAIYRKQVFATEIVPPQHKKQPDY